MYPRGGRVASESESEEETPRPRRKSRMPRRPVRRRTHSSRRSSSRPRVAMPRPEPPAALAPIGFEHLDTDDDEEEEEEEEEGDGHLGPCIGFEALEKELLDRPYPKTVYKIQHRPRRTKSKRTSSQRAGSKREEEEDEEEEEESEKSVRVHFNPKEKPGPSILRVGTDSKRSKRKGTSSTSSKRSKRKEAKEPSSTSSRSSKRKEVKGASSTSSRSSKRKGAKGASSTSSRSSKREKSSKKSDGLPKSRVSESTTEVRVAVQQGTIVDAKGFSAERDAETLRKAMRGVGCDGKTVSAVLCTRSNKQRQELKVKYKSLFGRDLVKDIVSELHGHHEDVAVALLRTPAEFDAAEMRRAVAGAGTNESILIEILASRSNAEIAAMKEAYKRLYKRNLSKDIESDTSFHFKKLMTALCQGARDESGEVDPGRAASDAAALYKAGEKKLGTDESRFNAVIASQGFPQLQAVFEEYGKVSKNNLEKAIRKEFSGDIMNGLLAVIKCARHTPSYFAERLYLSMKGLGTKDRNLVRLVVSRSEVDMVQIKEAFQGRFGKSLESWIKGDTSGKYRDALLLLVRGNRTA